MNTEPPTGDDLERMLVAMKRTVLTRAAEQRPQPRRRGRRTGIVIGVIAVLALGATSGGVALGMIPQPFAAAPAPAPSTAPVEPSETPTRSSAPVVEEPTNTPTPTSAQVAGVIPTDCRAAVPATDYDRLLGAFPLQDAEGSVYGSDADWRVPELWCIWSDLHGDGSGVTIAFGKSDPADVAWLDDRDGWACAYQDGGRFCRATPSAPPGSSAEITTFFIKGTTWVEINQTNAPTNGLLKAIQQQVWG